MKSKGYTLIEVLVAILIFSLISGASFGIFALAMRIQKYSLASQQLLDQTSYAMEYMSRFLRMAKKDTSGTCITANKNYKITRGEKGIKFVNYKGECLEFFWEDTDNQLRIKSPTIGNIPLTSDDFEVTSLKLALSGAEQPPINYLQPKVTIFLEIKGKGTGYQPEIKIQTTVSQRDLDVEE